MADIFQPDIITLVTNLMRNKGFTLVELIIVILIIALLSVIGMSTYTTVQVDARNSKRKSDLKEIQSALEIYRGEHGLYPVTFVGSNLRWFGMCTTSWGTSVICGKDDGISSNGANGYIPGLAPEYMSRLPRDPKLNIVNSGSSNNTCNTNPNANTYLYRSDGVNFKILAFCAPEGELSPNDVFYDPVRPTYAWQISSSANVRNNW